MSYVSKWTSEQTEYLIKNYKEKTYEEMSDILNERKFIKSQKILKLPSQ